MTHVQSIASSTGTGTTSLTATISTTSGNGLCILVATDTAPTTVTCADNHGSATAHPNNPITAGGAKGWAFYLANVTGDAGNAVVATLNNASGGTIIVDEFSGVLSAAFIDATDSGSDGSNVTSHSAGSITTTGGNSDIWAGNAEDLASGTAVHTAGSGWTKGGENNDANSYVTSVTQYQVAKAQGSFTNAMTTSAASRFAGLLIALKNTGWTASGGGTTITPSVGALALAGLAATVAMTGSVTRTPAVGSMAFTGNAATVSVSGSATTAPSAGSLTLTGNTATVSVSGAQIITPSVGTLTLTGLQPIQDLTVAAPITGSLSLTGNLASILVNTIRVPSVGALTLTGNAASVATARTITPSLGSLTLTGLQATITVGASNTTIIPSVGSLSINGQAVTVAQSSPVIRPSTGVLTLTGNPLGSVSTTGGGYLTRPFSLNWWSH